MYTEQDEQQIKQLFQHYHLRHVSESNLYHFEADVFKRLNTPDSSPGFGIGFAAIIVFALALGLGIYFLLKPAETMKENNPAISSSQMLDLSAQNQPQDEDRTETIPIANVKLTSTPVVSSALPAGRQEAKDLATDMPDEELDQMAFDLYILEFLGEDEGLMDDFNRITNDLEILNPSTPL